jgi:SAM-dependent methyltransferase
MTGVTELVGREPRYEAPAENYRKHAADGLWNAHLDRPACLELLGDVSGKHVLDAACGPGFYASELIDRGAQVTGFDNSPRMVEFCRQLPGGGEFRVHDLNDPIDWLPAASVDLVLCALAYEYADNRAGALRPPTAPARHRASPLVPGLMVMSPPEPGSPRRTGH